MSLAHRTTIRCGGAVLAFLLRHGVHRGTERLARLSNLVCRRLHGRKVTCPLHSWTYSLETGEAQGADEGTIATYPVKIEDGRVLLDVSALAEKAAA